MRCFLGLLAIMLARSSHASHGYRRGTRVSTALKAAPVPADVAIGSLKKWLAEKQRSSKTMFGLTAFVVAGDGDGDGGTVHTIGAGDKVVAKAWDLKAKKAVNAKQQSVDSASTSFMLASTSKLVVWTSLTMLMDAGKFKLDDNIEAALPAAFNGKLRNLNHPSVPITYRMLYTHTTGLKDEFKGYLYGKQACGTDPLNPYPKASLTKTLAAIVTSKNRWAQSRPGAKFLYSNYGSTLAAILVEVHSGESFAKFTQSYIFSPLGMDATRWTRPSDGSAAQQYTYKKTLENSNKGPGTYADGYCFPDWPSGQLWSSAADLGKFATAMLLRGQLLSPSSAGATCLYSPQSGRKAFERQSNCKQDGCDAALGWFAGDPYYKGGVGHDGSESGTSADFYINLDSGVAVGWLANGELSDAEYVSISKKLNQVAESIGTVPAAAAAAIATRSCRTVLSAAGAAPTPPPPATTAPEPTTKQPSPPPATPPPPPPPPPPPSSAPSIQGKVMFTGDSDIEGWSTAKTFPGSVNVGVGGWTCKNVLNKIGQQLRAHNPDWVVLVCGENDLAGGTAVGTAFSRYSSIVAKIHAAGARVLYMGTKPEPVQWAQSLHDEYRAYDAKIRALAASSAALDTSARPPLVMVDVYEGFEAVGNGNNLYQNDKLHLSSQGYALWTTWATQAMSTESTTAMQVVVDCYQWRSGSCLARTDADATPPPPPPSPPSPPPPPPPPPSPPPPPPPLTQVSEVKCSKLEPHFDFRYNNKDVCGASKQRAANGKEKCFGKRATHGTAANTCERVGARLCTATELKSDVARGSGCSLDSKAVWTAITCKRGNGKAGWLAVQRGRSDTCLHANSKKPGIRCCADAATDDDDDGDDDDGYYGYAYDDDDRNRT